MAIINFEDNRTNDLTVGTTKSYCHICTNKEVMEDKSNEPSYIKMEKAIDKFKGANASEQVLKIRVSGKDITICKKCIKSFNKIMNPCTCKKDAISTEISVDEIINNATGETVTKADKNKKGKKGGK